MTRTARVFAHGLLAALAAFFLLAGAAEADLHFPAFSGRVVDEAGILSQDTQDKLTALLAEHEQQTGNQVVVATVKSLDGDDVRDYGYKLGRAWGIGQKGKNNGVLILVSLDPKKIDIEVGYGLEGTLTDEDSGLIIREAMQPYFKKGDYDSGVLAGTVLVLKSLGGNPSNTASLPQPEEQQQSDHGGGIPIFVIVVILWLVFGRFFWPLLFLGGIGGGWGRGGGFGGGGFGGGGFSGGGGGSFGGGGASGSW